jgi:hypothetical protein
VTKQELVIGQDYLANIRGKHCKVTLTSITTHERRTVFGVRNHETGRVCGLKSARKFIRQAT